ncbi:peptidylprolyl isomerase [Bordetella holmesii]|uniref:peptidylprolyl isomerase n=2 Tax=Bordetella holmesii TaxID=35814 RepID=A0A158M2P3_9BORD|nr:peptidylprolyl isomerase [Bordetella holmesii]AHV93062.1 PPIC-type PPIASE domain protein [Bordetella holmesii ATCC 51541]AIT26896.1 PPIC-type PPIASE domain protein [Bordetella holmesii 44057]EWM42100.1 PPIC-type PPIASE domain protein [Bordetella holmesii 41130]EWM47480.1 PPIC-type PPIASE domain protein [Bordetella holmesii 35009]EWM51645.1 PPIC-type PPIASE domain protein [Bordetella holmesii 70147]
MKRILMLAAACAIAMPVYAQNVATVNGKAIPQKSLDDFVKLLVSQGATDSPQLREQVKQEMINRQVFVQAAEKQGIGKQPDIQTEVELARQGILVRALMADHLQKNPVTDATVKAEYEKIKKEQAGKQEYEVRHILVEDEKTANDLLAQIKSGKLKFEDAAKKNSKDPGSAERGGDLGWAPPTNYVPPFAEAVSKLKKGQLVDKPVQTQFGWHIIQVQDTRPVEFPPLEQVRPQLEEMMRQQKLNAFQKDLREKAKVQ